MTQLLELSRTRADEGWLHIDANEQRLRECCLAALACHVEEELERRESTPTGRADRAAVFLTVWDELFFTGSFRIGVNHRTDMGAAQGAMAKGVVYDVCPSASQFHCFPVQTHPSSVRSIFAESILDF